MIRRFQAMRSNHGVCHRCGDKIEKGEKVVSRLAKNKWNRYHEECFDSLYNVGVIRK